MTQESQLFAAILEFDDALEALEALKREGFRRAAIIHRQGNDEPRTVHPGRRNRPAWRLLAGVVSAASAVAAAAANPTVLAALPAPARLALAGALGLGAGFLAGWLLSRAASPRVSAELIDEQARLLAPDENLLVVEAPLAQLRWVLPLLREESGAEPAVFPFHPARGLQGVERDQARVALPLSQLQVHAQRMAQEHRIERSQGGPEVLLEVADRLRRDIHLICGDLGEAAQLELGVGPVAEWILDNEYIVEAHVRDVQANLSRRFYRQLPVLVTGPMRGLPRVYGLARELIMHTDLRVDRMTLLGFLEAYQTRQVLTIGELWALPMMLRIALVHSAQRLAVQALEEVRQGEMADFWASRLVTMGRRDPGQLFAVIAELTQRLPEPDPYFGTQLAAQLYDEEAALVPVQSWLERSWRRPLSQVQQREQSRQAGEQVSMGNAITSLRQLALLDWREVFEKQSLVERALRRDPAGIYVQMDFDTRNRYREAVEWMARRTGMEEVAVADQAVALARQHAERDSASQRIGHVGAFLVAEGRPEMLRTINCRQPLAHRVRGWIHRHHTQIYLGAVVLWTGLQLALAWQFALRGTNAWLQMLALLLLALPASQLAVDLTNYLVSRIMPPRTLAKLNFERSGIPDAFKTLVTVPVMFDDRESIQAEIEQLEIRYLANPERNLAFSLFVDDADAPVEAEPHDTQLLALAEAGVRQLNVKYPQAEFFLFYRPRTWSATEGAYIGWERKRGKLEELNRRILGLPTQHEGELVRVGEPDRLADIRFVITLDRDTQLPRDSARRMIETLAHPLNKPIVGRLGQVHDGYTIVQPRVTTSLPSATSSPFSRLFTNPVGVDPYTKAVSDAYQDLVGEGSYHGKGIYEVRAFHQILAGRFPQERLLSHDLIEGAHVRVGLASDVELFDDFPPDYLTYSRREHRWIRGDWQIAEWILPSVPAANGRRRRNPLTLFNRWKIFDNLRRSLVAPASVGLLVVSWLLGPAASAVAAALVGGVLLFQPLALPLTWATTPGAIRSFSPGQAARELLRAAAKAALLPHEAGLALDAIVRACFRQWVSKRHLLQWRSGRAAAGGTAAQLPAFLALLFAAALASAGAAFRLWTAGSASLPLAIPWLGLWTASPVIGWLLNRPEESADRDLHLTGRDLRFLRRVARRTWRYFDEFVTEDTGWLPPDNFQVSHQNELALRTSPTNLAMYLLSTLAAGDFGYLTATQVLERLEQTLATVERLERHQGHLLNWYRLPDLSPLEPRYVSFVDSGNLVGALWALGQGLADGRHQPLLGSRPLDGLVDTLETLRERLQANPDAAGSEAYQLWREQLPDRQPSWGRMVETLLRLGAAVEPSTTGAADDDYWPEQFRRQLAAWRKLIGEFAGWLAPMRQLTPADIAGLSVSARQAVADAVRQEPTLIQLAMGVSPAHKALQAVRAESEPAWLEACQLQLDEAQAKAAGLVERIEVLVKAIEALAAGVDLGFLYDRDRRLFAVGFNVSENRPDNAYYDLLASEARLGSFVAIARGEVPAEHWFSLGRPYGLHGRRRILMSWTGTMFEYLMPLLLQKTYTNSLLAKASEEAVQLQMEYARSRRGPWGISESAYGDLDLNKTYQYRAFGVPWLGLKRGLEADQVVAPYATMLALPLAPVAGVDNLRRLRRLGLWNEYGYYEAIDFSRRPGPDLPSGVIVRAYMAHHQGMSFLALVNVLHADIMQQRFHGDPRVKATAPLLYERIPVAPVLHHLPTREELPVRVGAVSQEPSVSRFETPHTNTPRVQLLGNGRYSLMISNAGGGYSRWQGLEINRWRADTTQDDWGTFCYLKDLDSGRIWSNTYQPTAGQADDYEARFPLDRVEFDRREAGIETKTEIIVSTEDDVEIRRLTLANRSLRVRHIELTTYLELAMAEHRTDRQHPAFNKLFIQTEALADRRTLLASRRSRSPDERPIWVGHRLTFREGTAGPFAFETDRAAFIGRGRSLRRPMGVEHELTNAAGYVLDPILSLRGSLRLAPGQQATVSMIVGAASTRQAAVALMEKYADPTTIERSFELSWASTQLALRMLRIHPDEARRFQKLASFMLYPSGLQRPPEERIKDSLKGQAGLWPYGISGDVPIALATIGEVQDLALVRQLLQAHSYWRQQGLVADLVIMNEESSGYDRPLKERLDGLIDAYAAYAGIEGPGGVYLLSADQLPEEDVTLLLAAARVSLVAARGPLAQQLGTPAEAPEPPAPIEVRTVEEEPPAPLPYLDLPYFNSLGGFTQDGREYVTYLAPGSETPVPWVNVMANPNFGALAGESGAGTTWSGNSQRNRLTPWSNDPVMDPASEVIYLRDEDSGQFWTPTAKPIRTGAAYRARHGAGYTVYEHNSHGLEAELTVFVPVDEAGGDPIKVSRLRLRNDSGRTRRISATYYLGWVLGEHREETQPHIVTDWDETAGAILATNSYREQGADLVAFAAMDPAATSYSGDRTAFIGRNGDLGQPAALTQTNLPNRVGGVLDPCAALQSAIELEPGGQAEFIFLLGEAESEAAARILVAKYRENLAVELALESTRRWWDQLLDGIHVQTPELSADFLINRWLLYQTLSCRLWGRTALYQSGGAFGFRDQLQDGLALLHQQPELARRQILRAAGRQFEEGDVQHWWHPAGGGIRSRISDDMLWLPYCVARYVEVTGDTAILEEQAPFLQARPLQPDEAEAYLTPTVTSQTASLWEHCRRAVARGLTHGPHGLPLIGAGDWNDGLNRIGIEGKGESVWLGWFLISVLKGMADLAGLRGESGEQAAYLEQAGTLARRIEQVAWDGAWYLRAFTDQGVPLGSSASEEGWIDSLPQSWAWLSGQADEERATRAFESAQRHLVRPNEGLVLLFTPPFDRLEPSPGYIRAYPPGVRENGGQYTHAAIWLAMAAARAHRGDEAVELLRLINPIEHAKDAAGVGRYQLEPYVLAGDVYRLTGRIGQGGWSWYTGSAGWMYQAWVDEVLGLKRRGTRLRIDPVIPAWWDGFTVRYRHGEAVYWIEVRNPDSVSTGLAWVEVDGQRVEDGWIQLDPGPVKHRVMVRMGKGADGSSP